MEKKTRSLVLRRRRKIITKELPLIFGIGGVARCGKDTFAKFLKEKITRTGFSAVKTSFADELKKEMDEFVYDKFGFSAFTEIDEEKDLIRPLLVSYGTEVCRKKIDEKYWIKKLEKRVKACITNEVISIIPDVRYENEAKWIKELGGYVIHIERIGKKPANFEEKSNDPIIKKISDFNIRWKEFTDEKETCSYHLSKLFCENNWSVYGEFK